MARSYRTLPPILLLLLSVVVTGCTNHLGGEGGSSGPGEGYLHWNDRRIPITYDVRDGQAVWQGDVVLGRWLEPEGAPSELMETRNELYASGNTGHLWPHGVVPFEIDPALPAPERVHQAIAHWEARTELVFVPRRSETAFVRFVPDASGCRATLGHQGTEQHVWLASACTAETVVHEIGHAVGLHHEHVRPDRDEHVVVHWDNVDPAMRQWFEIVDTGRPVGGYDVRSVMHYSSHAFSHNGQPTILTRAGAEIPYGRELSGAESAALDDLYRDQLGCAQVGRWAGADRYSTAAAISRGSRSAASVALLVSGADSAQVDALAAAPLAHHLGGPVLLTDRDGVPAPTRDELSRLGVRTVYLVGGTVAISSAVRDQLQSWGYHVDRISGPDRFATAAAIAGRMGPASEAFVLSGHALVDAVSASAAGAALGRPVLLVTRDSVPEATRAAIRELGIGSVAVVGGTGVISNAVMSELPSPVRLSGPSRYETSFDVAAYVHDRVGSRSLLVARGDNIVDGVVGGAVGRPLLLSPPSRLAPVVGDFLTDREVAEVTLLGGPGALSSDVAQATCHYVNNAT